MRIEIVLFIITACILINIYHDNKYYKIFLSYKKYLQMAFIAFLGIVFYFVLKKNPERCKNMLLQANTMIKYMPIDKSSLDMLSPIIDFTARQNATQNHIQTGFVQDINTNVVNKIKRSVSETKKKYIASSQGWKCQNCQSVLNAWFEVDHKVRLEHGGSNDVSNLVALCRECHGGKTAMENM
jgi:hypothetical protein